MRPILPNILDRYFAAQNAHDIDAMVACFAPDAVVRDEGENVVGTQAIRAWKIETSSKYRITAEPLKSHPEGDGTIVIVKVSGTFPGSPANLTYRFGFSPEGRINALQVH
jgi:ketosteroid isomerase-like protein